MKSGTLRYIALTILTILSATVLSQEITVGEYIETYSNLAVEEMNKYGIPASITLAQGLLESGSGNSELARKANNHFGIKCHKGWKGKTYHTDDDRKNECFRKYRTAEESYRDHSLFLVSRDRYNLLFGLEITDYKSWAKGLKKAGYATNPRYADLLIRIVEENELYLFDSGKKVSQQSAVNSQQSFSADSAYVPGAPFEDVFVEKGGDDRNIYENNKVRFIYAREGDSWRSIAGEFGIYGWQIRKYNELKKRDDIQPGEVIYLERKKSRATNKSHIVREGESMRNISQRYGLKLKVLYRRNNIDKGTRVPPGTEILLK